MRPLHPLRLSRQPKPMIPEKEHSPEIPQDPPRMIAQERPVYSTSRIDLPPHAYKHMVNFYMRVCAYASTHLPLELPVQPLQLVFFLYALCPAHLAGKFCLTWSGHRCKRQKAHGTNFCKAPRASRGTGRKGRSQGKVHKGHRWKRLIVEAAHMFEDHLLVEDEHG